MMTIRLRLVLLVFVIAACAPSLHCQPVRAGAGGDRSAEGPRPTGVSPFLDPPYPPSPVIENIVWHWGTHATAAQGSDLWPVAWGPDNHLYAAWGDGGGFGGSDSDGRVAMGFARIEGRPEHWRGVNVNGGKSPEHPASFPQKGKTAGVAFVDGVFYAMINLQDGTWPKVDHVLAWSTNKGATWTKADWVFAKGAGTFQPAKFLTFGKDYTGVPEPLAGYVYLYGPKQSADQGSGNRLYLARAPKNRLREQAAYEFFQKPDAAGKPVWVVESAQAQPVFSDPNGVTPGSVGYNPGLKRFVLTCFHVGPGQLGVFDAPSPWGPWTTVAYYEDWGGMGREGEGLTCGFPEKWMSADGRTLWSIFSVYGAGAKRGINAHDRFNLVEATLQLRGQESHELSDAAIEQYRKGRLVIEAAPGTEVMVEQQRHEFWFGAALASQAFNGSMGPEQREKYLSVFLTNFNAAVTENALKWHSMESRRGNINYRTVEAILAWTDQHQMPLRGHNVFWGVPDMVQGWLKQLSDEELRQTLQARAQDVAKRFRGRFAEYDLNNEMLHGNYYEQRLGPNITRDMAAWMRQEDPKAVLFLNDYDILTGKMVGAYVSQIRQFLDQGIPVGGIGVQGHLHGDSFDPVALKDALDRLAVFHLPIRVTEFNFPGQRSKYGQRPAQLSEEEEQAKARALVDYYRICFAHPAVEGIMMWGFWEGANWIPVSSLYRRDWTPLPAAEAYRDLVFNQWWTRWQGRTDAHGHCEVRAFYGRYLISVQGQDRVVNLRKSDGILRVSFP
ncbi:MAG: endo-1,4-beta-xylanase [Verrucomicrobiota bacterium]|jgi:GH35 family endo-1,4-beta-xylanase